MGKLQTKIRRAIDIVRFQGATGFVANMRESAWKFNQSRRYRKWIQRNDLASKERRIAIQNRIGGFASKPLISVLIPVYNVEEKWLRLCIESVLNQTYEHWELCIADDNSTNPNIRKILNEYSAKDRRIKVVFREENGHISAASNSALELATGEFTALLDHDDELSSDALFWVAKELNDFSETAFIYSDEDLIDERGKRFSPHFKPDFSRDYFYSLNLITHLSAYRTEILRNIGGFRVGLEGSQDYDLALRVLEVINEKQIRHIPRILYHWRAIPGSVAYSSGEKPYAHERARIAIREHLARMGSTCEVVEAKYSLHRLVPGFSPETHVCVVSSDKHIVEKFRAKTSARRFTFIVPDDRDSKSRAEILNQVVRDTEADVLIFLEDEIVPKDFGALEEIAAHAIRDGIGAVGARILNSDGRIRHAGIVFTPDGKINFAHLGVDPKIEGWLFRTDLINNFSAVSGVIAIPKDIFESAGGFDIADFSNGLYDLDLCLRLREKGLRVLWTPYAEFIQTKISPMEKLCAEDNSNELKDFRKRWRNVFENDPFFNPNLTMENGRFCVSHNRRPKNL